MEDQDRVLGTWCVEPEQELRLETWPVWGLPCITRWLHEEKVLLVDVVAMMWQPLLRVLGDSAEKAIEHQFNAWWYGRLKVEQSHQS